MAQSTGSVGDSFFPKGYKFRVYRADRTLRVNYQDPQDYHRPADVGDPERFLEALQMATGLSFTRSTRYDQFKTLWGKTDDTPNLPVDGKPHFCPECRFPYGGIKLLIYNEPAGEAPSSTNAQRRGERT